MSANYDRSQKFTFLYTNLYNVYQKGKKAAKESDLSFLYGESPKRDPQSHILKVKDLKTGDVKVNVQEYRPLQFIRQKRAEQKPALGAVESLKQNLKKLNDLQSRLQMMLQELEEFSKKS